MPKILKNYNILRKKFQQIASQPIEIRKPSLNLPAQRQGAYDIIDMRSRKKTRFVDFQALFSKIFPLIYFLTIYPLIFIEKSLSSKMLSLFL